MKEKLKNIREKYLPYDEKTLCRLARIASVTFSIILIWALVFKLGSEILLIRIYTNWKDATFEERILWDLIPFNYRGEDYWIMRQIIDTVLNCFVFAPLGVMLCYVFKKPNVWLNAAICLGFSVCVELIQLFTVLGNPATEDLITNVAGCFIGYAFYILIFKRLSVKKNVQICAITNVFLVFGVIFAIVTMAIASETIIGILSKTL